MSTFKTQLSYLFNLTVEEIIFYQFQWTLCRIPWTSRRQNQIKTLITSSTSPSPLKVRFPPKPPSIPSHHTPCPTPHPWFPFPVSVPLMPVAAMIVSISMATTPVSVLTLTVTLTLTLIGSGPRPTVEGKSTCSVLLKGTSLILPNKMDYKIYKQLINRHFLWLWLLSLILLLLYKVNIVPTKLTEGYYVHHSERWTMAILIAYVMLEMDGQSFNWANSFITTIVVSTFIVAVIVITPSLNKQTNTPLSTSCAVALSSFCADRRTMSFLSENENQTYL